MPLDGLSLIKDGWFMEKGQLWPGQAMSLEVEEVLHHSKSQLQDVLVFKSKHYGNVLVLDGVIQCTQRDEFSYQEMITHLPMYSHPNPQSVLVVGGGDGGVIREVLKHPNVQRAVLCEIDPVVTEVTRNYLPAMAVSLDDERVTVVHADGSKYLEDHKNEFDVIITDSSDPIGPAEVLFEPPFFKKMKDSLRDGGVLCTQGECMWLHINLIRPLMTACAEMFASVRYAYTTIPTYPSGQIGFILCTKSKDIDVQNPVRKPDAKVQKMLRYYNHDLHKAAFVLPQFAKEALGDA